MPDAGVGCLPAWACSTFIRLLTQQNELSRLTDQADISDVLIMPGRGGGLVWANIAKAVSHLNDPLARHEGRHSDSEGRHCSTPCLPTARPASIKLMITSSCSCRLRLSPPSRPCPLSPARKQNELTLSRGKLGAPQTCEKLFKHIINSDQANCSAQVLPYRPGTGREAGERKRYLN